MFWGWKKKCLKIILTNTATKGVSKRIVMELTEKLKAEIDQRSYVSLLEQWRMAPLGDQMFQGESGKYFAQRMKELRGSGVDHVSASKSIGWRN